MRILKINDTIVKIDEQTAIGIDYQAYDIKSPGKRIINVSNTFSIPKVTENMAVFGLASNPQSLSNQVYDINYCSYWVDNQIFIENAKCRVESIDERINLFIFEKKDIWDQLKEDTWTMTVGKLIIWMWDAKGLPDIIANPYTGTFDDFIDEYANNTEGLILPLSKSNLYRFTESIGGSKPETSITTVLNSIKESGGVTETSIGAHWCCYVKTLFEFIEAEYGVNFLTAGGQVNGNIWDDPVALSLFIFIPRIKITASGINSACTIGFTTIGSSDIFEPYKNIQDKADKTLYDFVMAFFNHLNIIVDNIELNDESVFALRRFDQLEDDAEIKNWSGNLSGGVTFKPAFNNCAQNNYIKFKSIYKDGDSLINSRNLTSLNKNLDYKTDLFEIDSHIPAIIEVNTDDYLDLSYEESFKTFVFMVAGDPTTTAHVIAYNTSSSTALNSAYDLLKANIYSLEDEYLLLESALQYPKLYEVQAWLTPSDIRALQFFRMYYFKELNGSFFMNKITGFNPDKSNEPTKLELLRISDKTPDLTEDIAYWADGEDNIFTNGDDEYLY